MATYIFGAGDLAREVYYTIQLSHPNTPIKNFVINESPDFKPLNVDGIEVITENELSNDDWKNASFIIAIGNAQVKENVKNLILAKGANLADSVIHPTAWVANNVIIEEGCFIAANTSISIACVIKNNTIINQNCSIGHDCVIETNSVISPGVIISGRCNINESCFIGSAAVLVPNITVGTGSIIGANVTVAQDVDSYSKVLSVTRNISLPIEKK